VVAGCRKGGVYFDGGWILLIQELLERHVILKYRRDLKHVKSTQHESLRSYLYGRI
jgi:hypothetical protein